MDGQRQVTGVVGEPSSPTSSGVALVEIRKIIKSFGATLALKGVSFSIEENETLGLLGANGAGKSTLIKVLSGIYPQTAGQILVRGEAKSIASPVDARDCGIATVHQNIDDAVVFGMTVAENLLLDELGNSSAGFFMNQRSILKRARQIEEQLQLKLPLTAPVESLSASGRQEVAIARALVKNPKLLILDEPTSTLSARETERLFEAVADLRRRGIAVLYVSHRMSEIKLLCDRAVVLRNGQIASEHSQPLDTTAIAHSILGELVLANKHEPRAGRETVFVGKGLRVAPDSKSFDVTLRKGEVIGLTGLVGAGKTEFLEQLYGARPLVSGAMELDGQDFAPRDATDALSMGVAMVSEERAKQSIFPGESLSKHCSIGKMDFFSRYGFMDRRKEIEFTRAVIKYYHVRAPGSEAPMEALSGGNQQKLLVGRWLEHNWSLLILDEPFRGIDIGARGIISEALRKFSEHGAVIVCSSDPEEVIEVADRVLIMVEGRIQREVIANELNAEQLSEIMSQTLPEAASGGGIPT
jgi:simple sugar transport system ATP-binding protein